MNFANHLIKSTSNIIWNNETFSCSHIINEAYKLSGLIKDINSDYIGLLSENNPFFISAYLSILFCGKCAVLLPEESFVHKIENYIGGFVTSKNYNINSRAPVIREGDYSNNYYKKEVSNDSPAVVIFTSGSTGVPKGVQITHRNLECNTNDILSYMHLNNDKVFLVLPMTFSFGLSILNTHLKSNSDIYLNNRMFMFGEKILDDIEENKCTGFAGVPTHYNLLIKNTTFLKRRLDNIKWFQQAGGALSKDHIISIRKAFPDKRLYIMYGQTEATARISYLDPNDIDRKIGSIGKGLPSLQLKILENGELTVGGDSIASCYWPCGTKIGPILRTGDIATKDSEGYVYIIGRNNDFIKVMGHRINIKNIEDKILSNNLITECAVIKIQDQITDEAIVVFINGNISEKDFINWCRNNFNNYEIPKQVIIINSIPKTTSGKIDKVKLLEIYATRTY